MYANYISHHGILGQKWGKKNGPPYPLNSSVKKSKSSSDDKKEDEAKTESRPKKSVKDLSDDELKERIHRLELEKKYSDLSKSTEVKKISKGKAFVMDVLEKSGKNIATQFTTYVMGTAVNKLAGSDIVNPKKGQKDK